DLRLLLAHPRQDPRHAARRAGPGVPPGGTVRQAGAVTASGGSRLVLPLHLAVIALLFGIQFVLPEYHHISVTRVMVLVAYATGYNVLFGYSGLLGRDHAMFFAAGLYAAGLTVHYLAIDVLAGFLAGTAPGRGAAVAIGRLALRTSGVAF